MMIPLLKKQIGLPEPRLMRKAQDKGNGNTARITTNIDIPWDTNPKDALRVNTLSSERAITSADVAEIISVARSKA